MEFYSQKEIYSPSIICFSEKKNRKDYFIFSNRILLMSWVYANEENGQRKMTFICIYMLIVETCWYYYVVDCRGVETMCEIGTTTSLISSGIYYLASQFPKVSNMDQWRRNYYLILILILINC